MEDNFNMRKKEECLMSSSIHKKLRNKNRILIILNIILIVLISLCLIYVQIFREIKLNGPAEVHLEVGQKYVDQGVNLKLARKTGKIDTRKAGEYKIKYTLFHQSITRKIVVVDKSEIVMGLKGSQHTLIREGDPYIESGAFAIDKKSGPIANSKIKIAGKVDSSTPGKYKIKYSVQLGAKKESISRTVEVIKNSEFKANKDGVPVMMYHYVYTETDKPKNVGTNHILDTDLEQQFKYLKQNNYYYPSYKELRAYIDGKIELPANSVILTFDDGEIGFLTYGIKLAEKYKIPITSFIIVSDDEGHKVRDYASTYVQFQTHSYDMHRAGGNIGHGGRISAMTKDEIIEDLKKSTKACGNNEAFAYPFGDCTNDAKSATEEAGIICSFTTEYGKVKKHADYRALPRVRVSGSNSLDIWKTSISGT